MSVGVRRAGAWALGALLMAALSGCDERGAPGAAGTSAGERPLTVHKSPTCGCCTDWADYMAAQGFTVELVDTDELGAVKDRLGVPRDLRSCHTATFGDYVFEGHVPVEDIRRLLQTAPGGMLAVPGMPLGSPGMEDPRGSQPYDSVLVRADGTRAIFAHHPAP